MRSFPRLLGLLALGLALTLGAGCDSDDGVEVTPRDVQGDYDFVEFTFRPNATLLPTVNVLAALDEDDTLLEIFGTGQAQLEYEIEVADDDNDSGVLTGSITADEDEVRLTLNNEFGGRDRLLLPERVTFSRETADRLTTVSTDDGERVGFAATVDLEAFDDEGFEGQTSVPGELFITVER